MSFPHALTGHQQRRGSSLQQQLYRRGQRARSVQTLQDHQPQHHRGRIYAAPDAHARLLLEIVEHAY